MQTYRMHHRLVQILAALIATAFASCSITPPYSEQALKNATDLKADSLILIEKSNQPYSSHRKEITELEKQLRRAYEYSKGRPNNEEAVGQYDIMRDPSRRMLVGLLRRWEQKGTLPSATFRDDAADLVGRGWDTIIALETGRQPSEDN